MNKQQTTFENKITEKYGTIVSKFKILHYDWEMDNHGYVVNDGCKNKIITTNHGRLMETGIDYLRYKIKEYENAIEDTKEAIKISQNGKY
jgi:hypothetical protein